MLFRKEGFPEEGELVLCTVTSVQFHSVFVDIDEYGKGGMIHISEVAPGRIRNIRDYVKENKKVVCKVLKINQEKGYIDISLRRVNEKEKKRKIEEIKREQLAEKIVEKAAAKLGTKTEQLYADIQKKISNSYVSIYEFLEASSKDESLFGKFGIDEKSAKILDEITKLRIKPSEVEIMGKMKIMLYAPDGVSIIKESLKKALKSGGENLFFRVNYPLLKRCKRY